MRKAPLLVLLLLAGSPAGAATNQTGRYIIRLKAVPPPARLFKISDALEGQYQRGGRKVPYILVQPRKPGKFVLPRGLKPLVAYVEPEFRMWAVPAAPNSRSPAPRPLLDRRLARASRARAGKGIGEPASGSRTEVPEAKAAVSAMPPNDPYWSYQWGTLDTGFGVRLPTARAYTKGAGVTVGIIDSGVRSDLSDLRAISFLPPYNAILTRLGGTDDNGHGSHVCGTIAQVTDNRLGCAGIAPAARILPVKALGADGRGTNFSIGAGIRYAVDQGCQVINLSIGGSPSRTLKDAVDYATSKDVLLICSSGNGGNAALTYPAAYSETLSVGAIENSGSRANFSQYGRGLGIVAPGVDILQQTFNQRTGQPGFYYFSGTSMAAPMVTGVAALVKSLRPGLSRAELKLLLLGTATDLGPRGADVQYGAGLVNAAAACARAAGSGGGPVPPGVPPVEPPVPVPVPAPGTEAIVAEVLQIVNAERARGGVSPLTLHPALITAAAAHAADMRARNVMSHTGADGSNPGQRMTRAGYPWITYGENIAMGFQTAGGVMDAWLHSPGHRANILNPNFKEIGIAKDGAFWCQTFGARRQ